MASSENAENVQTTMKIICLLSVMFVVVQTEEIRCYCNLSECVSTSYMCKSSEGVCFSEVSADGDLSKSRNGCLHLLRGAKRQICKDRALIFNPVLKNNNNKIFPHLSCCSQDMCNYMDCLDIKIHIHTKSDHNYSTGGMSGEDRDVLIGTSAEHTSSGSSNELLRHDLWFKAAVIAVPIAGGFILIMLILLAVQLLRKDNKIHRQMLELKRLKQFRALLLDGELPLHQPSLYCESHANEKTLYSTCNNARENKNYLVVVNHHEKLLTKDKNKYDYNLLLEKPLNTDSANREALKWAHMPGHHPNLLTPV